LKATEAEVGAAVKGVNEMIKHAERIKQGRPSSETLARLTNYELSRIPEIEPSQVKKPKFTTFTFVPSEDLDRANLAIRKLNNIAQREHKGKTDALEEFGKFVKWAETIWPLDREHVEFLNKAMRALNYKSRLKTLGRDYDMVNDWYQEEIKKNFTLKIEYDEKLRAGQETISERDELIKKYQTLYTDYWKYTGKKWEELPAYQERAAARKRQLEEQRKREEQIRRREEQAEFEREQAQLYHDHSDSHGLHR
jgi:hypothetical protein